MNIWKKGALLIVTVALVGGGLYAGAAYAQTPTPTPETQQNQTESPATNLRGWFMDRFGGRGMMPGGRFGGHGMMPGGRFGGHGMMPGGRSGGHGMMPGGRSGERGMMGQPFGMMGFGDQSDIVAEALDMTTEELQAELDAGKSLLAIAEGQGLDETELQAAIQTVVSNRIDEAVAAGDLTQTQADALKARLERENSFFGRGLGSVGFGMRGPRMGGHALAGMIGDPRELLAEATEMSVEELEAAVKSVVEQRLESAVEEGTITQGEADAFLAQIDEGLPFFGGGLGGRFPRAGGEKGPGSK
jgi:hypothetical protein